MAGRKFLVTALFVLLGAAACRAEFRHYRFPDPPFIFGSTLRAYQIIDNVYPNSVSTGETALITVMGRDLQLGATIEVIPGTGLTISDLNVIPPSKITFKLAVSANAATGLRNLKVSNPAPGGTYEAYGALVITQPEGPAAAPEISSITPGTGEAGKTLTVTIEGTNFDSNAELAFAQYINVATYEVVNTTKIQAVLAISSEAVAGPVIFTIRNPDSGGVGYYFFTVVSPAPGFAITGVWPSLPNNEFPRESTVSPFIIVGTAISSDATVTFSDPNITYDVTKMTIDPAGKWIRIATLTIGSGAREGPSLFTVTNNRGQAGAATAVFSITIARQQVFLESIANLVPKGTYLGRSYYNPEKQTSAVYAFQVLREVPRLTIAVVGAHGIEQITNFPNVRFNSSFAVKGASASDVRTLRVSGTGTATVEVPLKTDHGQELSSGVHFFWVVDTETGQKIKAAMPIHSGD